MSDLSFAVQRALSNVTPYRILTGVGIGFAGFFVGGNVGANIFGIMPIISNPTLRNKFGISIGQAVSQWDWYFAQTMPIMASTAVACAVSFLTASFYVPKVLDDRLSKSAKICLRLAAAFAILPAPYTILFLKPTNDILMGMAKSGGKLSTIEASRAQTLLEKWNARHAIRVGLYSITLGLGVLSSLII